uniref:Uncharacterized protein n=1 Tax=Tetranychus urticae TaxID=32264 RepID=T1JZX8_TETUR
MYYVLFRSSSYRAYIQDGVKKIEKWCDLEKNTLIEYNGEMNIICYPQKDTKLFCFLPVEHVHWYNNPFDGHRIHACILKDVCYIITKSLTFLKCVTVDKIATKDYDFRHLQKDLELYGTDTF